MGNMIIITILGLIVVIAIIYFITAGEKLNKENSIGNYQFESVDVASKMIEDHKANVLTFLEEREPIDLRDDEQYAMLNILEYETKLDIIELKECFRLGFKEALIYFNSMGMLKLN